MASKKIKEEVTVQQAAGVETHGACPQEEPARAAQGPPITDCVRLVNLTRMPQNPALRNGRFVPLAPGPSPQGKHKSEPIQRKLLTPMVFALVKKNMLAIEPAEGGA
jgi:hypothetical protein